MAAVGFDLGSLTCYVAATKSRGVETLDNEYSDRCTPLCISYTPNKRLVGFSAMGRCIVDSKNTLTCFRNLIGLKFSDPMAKYEMAFVDGVEFVQLDNDDIGVKIRYMEEQNVFTIIQLVTGILSGLKATVEKHIPTLLKSVVLNCPVYFNNNQRRALMSAAKAAKLDVLNVMNDTIATALTYGMYRGGLNEPDKIVMFLDIGYSSTQLSICKFKGNTINTLASSGTCKFGARNVDYALAEHLRNEFIKKHSLDPKSRIRVWKRLLQEASNFKKRLNSINQSLPFNIDCFMDDIDFSTTLTRDQMDSLYSELMISELNNIFDLCFKNSNLKPENIEAVEIVGGSTRLHSVKTYLENMKLVISSTLNLDEAVARGCTFLCAKISPNIKIKEMELTDVTLYPIKMAVMNDGKKVNEAELYHPGKSSPFRCSVTVKPYSKLEVVISQVFNGNLLETGHWVVRGASSDQTDATVKLVMRQDESGLCNLIEAHQIEAVTDPAEATETDGKKNKKDKKVTVLKIEWIPNSFQSQPMIDHYIKIEDEILSNTKKEVDKEEAKNMYENFIYSFRDELNGKFSELMNEEDREILMKRLAEEEDWLYNDGENVIVNEYRLKLKHLNDLHYEYAHQMKLREDLPVVFEKYESSLLKYRKILSLYNDQSNDQYKHIDQEIMNKMNTYVEDYSNKLIGYKKSLNESKKTDKLHMNLSTLNDEIVNLEKFCEPIINIKKEIPIKEQIEEPPSIVEAEENKIDENIADNQEE